MQIDEWIKQSGRIQYSVWDGTMSEDDETIYTVKEKENQSKLGNLLNTPINYLMHKKIGVPEKNTEDQERKAVSDITDKDMVDANKEEMKLLKPYKELDEAVSKESLAREHEIQHLKESVGKEGKGKLIENEQTGFKNSMPIQSDGVSSVLITQQGKLNIIPTGITSFDPLIMGGFPAGSLVLMIADAGAGNTEFAYTSAANLFWLKNDLARFNSVKYQLQGCLAKEGNLKIPESICYISLAHSKDDILKELRYAFPSDFIKYWNGKGFFFKDFSSFSSISPTFEFEKDWSSTIGMKGDGKLSLLRELISTLEFQAPNSLVIIDSLNRLIKASGLEWNECVSFLEDLQKKSKKWDGLVYLLLGKGIFENPKEEELMDIADGVLAFKWKEEGFINQQTMEIIKFRGLMPRMAKENIVRFDISVTSTDGFAVTNVKRISGRR